MPKKKNIASKDYQEYLIESLKDPKEAAAYLNAALEEEDMPELFLLSLRNVADAHGVQWLAEETHLNRENLYRMLSKKGNPVLSSLYEVLGALGLKLAIEQRRKKHIAA
ncbi:MAG: putative addiction module antidote protein [Deltaproteobacteria bacterium]|nr:putative addiction module antidote protein [Deltaproteobacteria bacterium]